MLRIDFKLANNGNVNLLFVSENGDSHSIAGRLVLTEEEYKNLREACYSWDEDTEYKLIAGRLKVAKEPFFKFEEVK